MHCALVSTYSELWLFKIMKRQCLEVMCPGVVLHYRQLVRKQTHPKVSINFVFFSLTPFRQCSW